MPLTRLVKNNLPISGGSDVRYTPPNEKKIKLQLIQMKGFSFLNKSIFTKIRGEVFCEIQIIFQ